MLPGKSSIDITRSRRLFLTVACALVAFVYPALATAPASDSNVAADPGPTELTSGDWWPQVRANLEAREYHASRGKMGLQAPNRAQNLRTYFSDDHIEVVPRSESTASWRWSSSSAP